jgi:CRISPR-associated endoribonuclease Cas6
MFASFVIHLRPVTVAPLGRTLGRSLHGLLLKLISQNDPVLANALHSDLSPKPFTASTLRGQLVRQKGRLCAVPSERYRVRYTVMMDEIFNALGHVLKERLVVHTPVEIDGNPFLLEDVVVAPELSEGWARMATAEQLLVEAGIGDKVTLYFASPTTFRTGDTNLLFPLPTSVFGSLTRKWEVFCIEPLPPDLDEFISEQVVAERYTLETQVVSYGGHQFNGFVGDCQFRVIDKNPTYCQAVNALAGFALFAGVGQKTTQGLGQTKRID